MLAMSVSCGFILAGQLLWSLPCHAQSATAWPEADLLFHSDPLWLGGDGAFSVDLGHERVLWLFGDSFIAKKPQKDRRGSRMVRNSLAIEKGYDPSKATIKFYWRKKNGEAQSFMAEKKNRWLWPLHGARLGDKLILFYSVIGPDHAPGGLGFKVLGATAFLVDNPDLEPDQWHLREVSVLENNWKIILGVAVVQRDNLLNIFGFDEPQHQLYLANLPVTQAREGDFRELEWLSIPWHQSRPQSVMREPPSVVLDEGSTECSVHWVEALRQYVEVQSSGFGASNITMRSSKNLFVGWSPPQEIYVPPESKQPEAFVYAGKAHPELLGADLIVTYAANGSERRLRDDMSIYFPRFVRCRLAK